LIFGSSYLSVLSVLTLIGIYWLECILFDQFSPMYFCCCFVHISCCAFLCCLFYSIWDCLHCVFSFFVILCHMLFFLVSCVMVRVHMIRCVSSASDPYYWCTAVVLLSFGHSQLYVYHSSPYCVHYPHFTLAFSASSSYLCFPTVLSFFCAWF
jgi:hypothetical protein